VSITSSDVSEHANVQRAVATGIISRARAVLLWTGELVREVMMVLFLFNATALFYLASGTVTMWVCRYVLVWPLWREDWSVTLRVAAALGWLAAWIHFWTFLDLFGEWTRERRAKREAGATDNADAEPKPSFFANGVIAAYGKKLGFQSAMVFFLNVPFILFMLGAKLWFTFVWHALLWPIWAFEWSGAVRVPVMIIWFGGVCLLWAWFRPPDPRKSS